MMRSRIPKLLAAVGFLATGMHLMVDNAWACSVCFTSVNGGSKLNAYYAITILLTVLALTFLGGIYYIVRRYSGAQSREE